MRHAMRILGLVVMLAAANVASAQLNADAADEIAHEEWAAYAERFAADTTAELAAGEMQAAGASLRFLAASFEDGVGEPCEAPCAASDQRRRPLFISLHGGGSAPPEVTRESSISQASTERSRPRMSTPPGLVLPR